MMIVAPRFLQLLGFSKLLSFSSSHKKRQLIAVIISVAMFQSYICFWSDFPKSLASDDFAWQMKPESVRSMDDFVSFTNSPEEAGSASKVVEWSKNEREIVRDLFQDVYELDQRLFVAYPQKLMVLRLSGSGWRGALAGHGRMFFHDGFFDRRYRKQRLTTVAHELVHAADIGKLVAHSKAWVEFAKPRMRKTRSILSVLKFEERKYLARRLRKDSFWPSIYRPDSFVEGLAEYYSAGLTSNFQTDLEFNQTAASLNSPSSAVLRWRALVQEGLTCLAKKRYQHALRPFLAAQKELSSPELEYCLAQVYADKNELDEALNHLEACKEQFDRLSIDCKERENYAATMLASKLYLQLGRPSKAKMLLDEILSIRPTDRVALLRRSECNELLGHKSLALADLMASKGFYLYQTIPVFADDPDDGFVLAVLETMSISSEINDVNVLLGHASLFERMASKAKSKDLARTYLTRALVNYEAAAKLGCKEALCSTADIYLRLGHKRKAVRLWKKLQKNVDHSLYADIGLFKILESRRSRSNTVRHDKEFLRLKHEIRELEPIEAWREMSANPFAILSVEQAFDLYKRSVEEELKPML
jgi:tetratricopeptide (TPR) repeat protein